MAASRFFKGGGYHLGGAPLDGEAMVAELDRWLDRYPIVSVEDGLAEEYWEHWPQWRRRAGDRALVLGDDLLCTNPDRIRRQSQTHARRHNVLRPCE